jgi:hypothetical protein
VAVLVVPLTMPLPAEIATPPAEAAPRPPLDEATAQRPFGPALLPVTTVLVAPPEPLTLTELLVCAAAIVAPKQTSAPTSNKVFTTNPFGDLGGGGETAARTCRASDPYRTLPWPWPRP